MDQSFKEALERIELLTEEICRIKRSLIAAANGEPFNESWNDELYLEESANKDSASSHLSRAIEHLLKLKYSTNDRNNRGWKRDFSNHLSDVEDYTKWRSKKNKQTNVIKYLINELQDIYEVGVAYYDKAAKKYPDLIPGLQFIPNECPWTLEELLDNTIDELLSVLPYEN